MAKNGRIHRTRICSASSRGRRSKLEKSKGVPPRFSDVGNPAVGCRRVVQGVDCVAVDWLPGTELSRAVSVLSVKLFGRDMGVAILWSGDKFCRETAFGVVREAGGSRGNAAYLHCFFAATQRAQTGRWRSQRTFDLAQFRHDFLRGGLDFCCGDDVFVEFMVIRVTVLALLLWARTPKVMQRSRLLHRNSERCLYGHVNLMVVRIVRLLGAYLYCRLGVPRAVVVSPWHRLI